MNALTLIISILTISSSVFAADYTTFDGIYAINGSKSDARCFLLSSRQEFAVVLSQVSDKSVRVLSGFDSPSQAQTFIDQLSQPDGPQVTIGDSHINASFVKINQPPKEEWPVLDTVCGFSQKSQTTFDGTTFNSTFRHYGNFGCLIPHYETKILHKNKDGSLKYVGKFGVDTYGNKWGGSPGTTTKPITCRLVKVP